MDTRATPPLHVATPSTASATAGARSVLVLYDDTVAAAPWVFALAAEGLGARGAALDGPRRSPEVAPDAWALHLVHGLPQRLARLRELRATAPQVPLLTVCQGLRDLDHVLALEMGADDVVDAGVPAPVVAARLRALWRRCAEHTDEPPPPNELCFGGLQLMRRERRALLGPRLVPLSDGEFELLWLLAMRAGQVVPRVELVPRLRGLQYQRDDRSIDCCVYRLRAKLGDDDPQARRIRTVRNRGYLLSSLPW